MRNWPFDQFETHNFKGITGEGGPRSIVKPLTNITLIFSYVHCIPLNGYCTEVRTSVARHPF